MKKTLLFLSFFCMSFAFFTAFAGAAPEATLTLKLKQNGLPLVYSYTELLKMSEAQSLQVDDDPSYPDKKIPYKVVRLASLFKNLKPQAEEIVQYVCLDGFSGAIKLEKLLNTDPKKAIAYLALEPLAEKWPRLKPHDAKTAGPFYLVWKNAKLSRIGSEEWPFQLASLELKNSLKDTYPELFPDARGLKKKNVATGFKVFTQNCLPCHTLNRSGEKQQQPAKIGPDLNYPHNPTEYLKIDYLKKLIRNPQNLRYWPAAKMPAFGVDKISAQELDSLIRYLQYMSKTKLPKGSGFLPLK